MAGGPGPFMAGGAPGQDGQQRGMINFRGGQRGNGFSRGRRFTGD